MFLLTLWSLFQVDLAYNCNGVFKGQYQTGGLTVSLTLMFIPNRPISTCLMQCMTFFQLMLQLQFLISYWTCCLRERFHRWPPQLLNQSVHHHWLLLKHLVSFKRLARAASPGLDFGLLPWSVKQKYDPSSKYLIWPLPHFFTDLVTIPDHNWVFPLYNKYVTTSQFPSIILFIVFMAILFIGPLGIVKK